MDDRECTCEDCNICVEYYRKALEFYANPISINASQHANGSINIWEGGGTDTIGSHARRVLATTQQATGLEKK